MTSNPPLRIALGGIWHETNTFNTRRTDMADVRGRTWLAGEALLSQAAGTRTVLGGVLTGAAQHGVELAPLLFAAAPAGGRLRRGVLEELLRDLLRRLAEARAQPAGVAGVVLVQHGALVVEGFASGDAEVLRRVRRLVGPRVPIATVLDFHANVSADLLRRSDIIVGYDSYPHVDAYVRGVEAVELLTRVLRDGVQPQHTWQPLPLLASLPRQRTDPALPFGAAVAVAQVAAQQPGILRVTVNGGFPYADTPHAGAAVVVTHLPAAAPVAARLAREVAAGLWMRRAELLPQAASLADAVAAAQACCGTQPLLLADVADNPGAGAAGDQRALLQALYAARVPGCLVAALHAPELVAAAAGAGVDGCLPVALPAGDLVTARVRWCGNLRAQHTSKLGAGAVTDAGLAAVLALPVNATRDDDLLLLATSARVQVLDADLLVAAGIAPQRQRVLALKSSVHLRAGFAGLVGDVLEVDGPGGAPLDLTSLPYRRVRRPIWPLDACADMDLPPVQVMLPDTDAASD